VVKGQYDEALAILLDFDALEGMSLTDYHRWSGNIWAVLDQEIKQTCVVELQDPRSILMTMSSEDYDSLAVLNALKLPNDVLRAKGSGGNMQEAVQRDTSAATTSSSIGHIQGLLAKAKKMQVSSLYAWSTAQLTLTLQDANAPSHLIMPLAFSGVQLAAQMGLWQLYRLGVVVLAEVMLSMEGAKLAQRALNEVKRVWDHVSL
jgi:anaphase-promoting complex subunit 5